MVEAMGFHDRKYTDHGAVTWPEKEVTNGSV
jgi:hypothetical protein